MAKRFQKVFKITRSTPTLPVEGVLAIAEVYHYEGAYILSVVPGSVNTITPLTYTTYPMSGVLKYITYGRRSDKKTEAYALEYLRTEAVQDLMSKKHGEVVLEEVLK